MVLYLIQILKFLLKMACMFFLKMKIQMHNILLFKLRLKIVVINSLALLAKISHFITKKMKKLNQFKFMNLTVKLNSCHTEIASLKARVLLVM